MKKIDLFQSPPMSVRPLPRNLALGDEQVFAGDLQYEHPVTSVERMQDVDAFGSGPLRQFGRYLSVSFSWRQAEETWYRERKHWRMKMEGLLRSRESMDAPALWITDNWSFNYFHWVCDALPRLEMASRVCDLSELTLLLPNKCWRCPFILESLAPFGLRSIRVLNRFEHLRCQNLVVPSHLAITGNYSPSIMTALRNRFMDHIDQTLGLRDSNLSSERIYISRRGAKRRRIHNEQDILPILHNHGFTPIVMEELTFFQQQKALRQAKYLVSIHGAGLTNMIAMAPGGSVLEIRDAIGPTPNCFFTLAATMLQQYYYLMADRVNPRIEAHSAYLNVDSKRLDQTLESMISSHSSVDARPSIQVA